MTEQAPAAPPVLPLVNLAAWLREHPATKAALDHPSLALAGLSSGAIILRSLSIAKFDSTVALAILNSSGIAGLILGSATTLVPLLLPLLWFMLYIGAPRQNASRSFGLVVLPALIVVLSPLSMVFGVALGWVAGFLLLRGWGRMRRSRPSTPPLRVADWGYAYLMALNFIWLLLISQPWLPAERISTTGPEIVGYVLAADGRWTEVLTERDRVVVFVDTTSVISREVCVPRGSPQTATDWLRANTGVGSQRDAPPQCPVI